MRELFLTSFGGIQYGIWKDEILSVRDLNALHRIPLSPACIAGVMIDDNRTVTLADLPVCMGYGSSHGVEQGGILLKQEGDKLMGFVVSGEIRTQSISPKLVFPLPDYLKTPVFDSCAVHDDIPIPLINTSVLHERVLKPDEEFVADLLQIPNARPQDVSGIAKVRIFTAGGELFAVSATGMEDKAVKPGPITPLPNTPQYVRGVTYWKGRLMPVIDLTQRIKRQSVAENALMLITEIGGAAFGLLIDGDGETMPANKSSIKPAPFIVQTSWLKHMVVRAGELIPLIDLVMALSPGAADEKPIWQRYAPDSAFPDIFLNRDADVLEFSLLGERHALPKVEVEDVISFKPCRALPDVPPIVIGVTEHNGEILPVVDLAMMFGRRSLTTSSWRMILVKNGDFRALVITGAVTGDRRLKLEIQRVVPIHLPHELVYGCYPDERVVRLILNVEAMSVYFEKSLVKKFLPGLSQEMKMSPTGEVYHFHDEKIGKVLQPETIAPAETVTPVETVIQSHAKPEPQQQPEKIASLKKRKPVTKASEITAEPESMDAAHTAASSTSTQESLSSSNASAQKEAAQKEAAQREAAQREAAQREQALRDRAQKEQTQRDQAQIDQALKEQARKEQVEREQARKVSAITSAQAAQKQEPVQAKSGAPSSAQTVIPMIKRAAAPASDAGRSSEPVRALTIDRPSGSYRTYHEEQHIIKTWKKMATYGAIATLLIAVLFYFMGASKKPVGEKSVQAVEPVKTEQAVIAPPPPKTEAELAKEKAELAKAQAAQDKLLAAQAKAQAKAEREAKIKADKEAKLKAKQEAKAKAEQDKLLAAQAQAQAKADREAKLKADKEAKLKAKQEANAKALAEHEAKLKAAQEAKVKTGQALVLSQADKAQTATPSPTEKIRAPLELEIPKRMQPIDIDVYVVVKGDTLWSISERFTGDPFNYPRIAGENKIANPDLIFPNQRIRLIK